MGIQAGLGRGVNPYEHRVWVECLTAMASPWLHLSIAMKWGGMDYFELLTLCVRATRMNMHAK